MRILALRHEDAEGAEFDFGVRSDYAKPSA